MLPNLLRYLSNPVTKISLLLIATCLFSFLAVAQSTIYTKYEPWMDRYLKGEYGLFQNLDEQGNRRVYEERGYSFSTTITDKSIYTTSAIAVMLLIATVYYYSNKKTFETIK